MLVADARSREENNSACGRAVKMVEAREEGVMQGRFSEGEKVII